MLDFLILVFRPCFEPMIPIPYEEHIIVELGDFIFYSVNIKNLILFLPNAISLSFKHLLFLSHSKHPNIEKK
jgi:hypothetical protein